jgi:hypothetical protein
MAASGRRKPPGEPTDYAIALKEIVKTAITVLTESGEQWNDAAKQDLVSTLFIQAAKNRQIAFRFGDPAK